MCYKLWTFKNPIFNSHFYSGVCWLLSPTFDSLFYTSEHLYFLFSPSLPNQILWIFVGVWAMENTLGTDNCVDLSLSPLESPFFSSCSPLSPSSLSYSSCNSVNLFGCPSWWRIFSPLTYKFYYQCCIVGEDLRLLEEWNWNPEAGDLSPKPEKTRKLLTTQNIKE